jgi:hypothetical protein
MIKHVFACISLAALAILLPETPASAATRVFLLGGQSNMAGLGAYSGYLPANWYPWTSDSQYQDAEPACPAPYSQQSTSVKFWNYSTSPTTNPNSVNSPGTGTAWIPLQNGYGYRTDTFGPELSFGAKLQEMYPEDEIYLIKTGLDGTSLGGDWKTSGAGAAYNLFKSRVTAALATLSGKNPIIQGMIWMQGESDAPVASYAANYATNLANFVSTVRSTFNAQSMKFVAGVITNMSVAALGATQANTDLVRNAQVSISSYISNSSSFGTDDLSWAYYGHYGTEGQIELGLRFAGAFTPTPEPSTLAMASVGLLCALGYFVRKRK